MRSFRVDGNVPAEQDSADDLARVPGLVVGDGRAADRLAPGAGRLVALEGADLTRAHLHGVNLTGAWLTGAHLDGADLPDAHLTGAHLLGATLAGAELTDVRWPDEPVPEGWMGDSDSGRLERERQLSEVTVHYL